MKPQTKTLAMLVVAGALTAAAFLKRPVKRPEPSGSWAPTKH